MGSLEVYFRIKTILLVSWSYLGLLPTIYLPISIYCLPTISTDLISTQFQDCLLHS